MRKRKRKDNRRYCSGRWSADVVATQPTLQYRSYAYFYISAYPSSPSLCLLCSVELNHFLLVYTGQIGIFQYMQQLGIAVTEICPDLRCLDRRGHLISFLSVLRLGSAQDFVREELNEIGGTVKLQTSRAEQSRGRFKCRLLNLEIKEEVEPGRVQDLVVIPPVLILVLSLVLVFIPLSISLISIPLLRLQRLEKNRIIKLQKMNFTCLPRCLQSKGWYVNYSVY